MSDYMLTTHEAERFLERDEVCEALEEAYGEATRATLQEDIDLWNEGELSALQYDEWWPQ